MHDLALVGHGTAVIDRLNLNTTCFGLPPSALGTGTNSAPVFTSSPRRCVRRPSSMSRTTVTAVLTARCPGSVRGAGELQVGGTDRVVRNRDARQRGVDLAGVEACSGRTPVLRSKL